uniref:Kinetochore protein NDC80 n=1 Tax=Haemonchus contortus TaxID=6289 RepID=A0A7I4YYY4_HAECO
MYGSERKKSMGATRWGVPSSTMKTPTRPRFTIGGTQINSSSKNDFNSGQPRFSIGGAVPASARRHSVFRSLTSNIKDTRPLTSKEYQCDMVRTIYEFLLEHDGENCLPERVIRSPTKQDFISMFESIYQHVNPDFQLKNVNEEVPAIFRELGYPTAIKPSTMQTIGAAHTWPTLLGALTWLIDNIKVCNQLQGKVGQELLLGGDDSNGTLKAYKYSWMNTVFKEYIQNRKDFMENDGAFDVNIERLRQWYEQQEDFDTQKQTIEANLEQIAEECKELEADKGNVERLQQDIARLDDDIAKAQEYKEKTDQDEKLLAETLDAVNVELATVRGQEKECRAKLAEVESAIKAQEETNGLCGTEARALIAEVDQNKLTLRKLKAELEDLCKQHWKAVPKTKSALAEQQGRFHKLVVDIRSLYPNACSEDTVVIDENPSDARALHLAVLKDCKSLLEDVEAKLLQQKWDLEQAIRKAISEAENIKQEDGVISGKLRERQRMDSRAERQRRRDRDDWEKDVIAEETEIDRLENEKEVLENKCHEVGSLKRDLETLRAENSEYSKILAEKQLKISDAILSRFHAVVSDLDMMKEAREWMMRKMEEMIALGEQIPSDSLLVEGHDED